MMKRILLTVVRAPATLHLARLLHAQGHSVYAADSCRFPITKASKAIKQFCHLPAPATDSEAYKEQLLALIQTHDIDWLIPTCEEVFHVSQHLASLQAKCQVLTDSLDKLNSFHNKWLFSQLVRDPEIQIPETHLLESHEQLRQKQEQTLAFVFKPVYSRFASRTLIRPHPEALTDIPVSPKAPWIAQKFIPGKEYSSYSIAHQGEVTLHCSYHSPYRAGQGAGIYFTAHASESIERFVRRFAKAHAYTGQLAFDFMKDTQGNLFVLECNPRLTSGIHLFSEASKAGDAILNTLPIGLDLLRPDGKTLPMLASMMWFYGLGQNNPAGFLRDYRAGQDVLWSPRDAGPFFYQPLSLLEMSVRSLAHRTSLISATTLDIEWNGYGRRD